MTDDIALTQELLHAAARVAAELRHEYVTPDHMGLAVLRDARLIQLLAGRAEPDALIGARNLLDARLRTSGHFSPCSPGDNPRSSQEFVRLINMFATNPDPLARLGATGPAVMLLNVIDCPETWTAWCMAEAGLARLVVEGALRLERAALENRIFWCADAVAEAKRHPPVTGRDADINRILTAVARQHKNSVLVVGPSGAGKTAVVRGVAAAIGDSDSHPALRGRPVWSTTVSMLATAGGKTEFEDNLKYVVMKVAEKKGILILDDAHALVGTGVVQRRGASGADLLKPFMESGSLPVIGTATEAEYRTTIAKDPATDRLFTKIFIEPLDVKATKQVLRGRKPGLEKHHAVKVPAALVSLAAELAAEHVKGVALPDAAIDVLDSACAQARRNAEGQKGRVALTAPDIEAQVASLGNLKDAGAIRTKSEAAASSAGLEKAVRRSIFGQDSAVKALCDAVLVARSGLHPDSGTAGAFLFAGPTGTGKTETATALAEALGVKLLKYDMSEYNEKHKVSSLLGAPPGYVGHNDGPGLIIGDIKTNPDAVVLLDEIEKAHESVTDIFLQVMDKGTLRSAGGEEADFSKAILVMTSNLGAEAATKNAMGFGGSLNNNNDDDAGHAVNEAVGKHFRPEFRNRLDAVVRFADLGPAVIKQIVARKVRELNDAARARKVKIKVTPAGAAWLAANGYEKGMGARPLNRLIRKVVSRGVAREMAGGKLKDGGVAELRINDSTGEPELIFTSNTGK